MSSLPLLCALLLQSGVEEHPRVPGFQAAYEKAPAEAGRLLLGELHCISCHKPEGPVAEHLSLKQAPLLRTVGERLRPDWIRAFLSDPQKVKPGTTMPKGNWTPEEIESLTHFLATLRSPKPPASPAGTAPKSGDLFNTVGCAACHDPVGKPAVPGSVPLPDLRAKYSGPAALARFLMDPLQVRPSGRMPKLNLSAGEAMAVAVSFVGLPPQEPVDAPDALPGIAWEVFAGQFAKLPDFDALKPAASGTSDRFDIGVAGREDNFAIRWSGYLVVPQDGIYGFQTKSDDGSRLFVGEVLVVDNDGVHGAVEAAGAVHLKKGLHPIVVGYFEAGGGEELSITWEGPGMKRQALSGKALRRAPAGKPVAAAPKPGGEAEFRPDPARVAKGRELFTTKRCSSCHDAGPDLKPLPFAPLAKIGRDGCLVGAPNTGKFHLSEPMTKAIRAGLDYLQGAAAGAAPTPEQQVERTLASLNCRACHERGGSGGVTPARQPYFTTTYEDTGDEGRNPPHLNGVGAKLLPAWLQKVLSAAPKVRPYMITRMPAFGDAAVKGLAAALEAADRPVAEAPPVRENAMVLAGRKLVGTDGGLSCVQCHTFQGHKSLGIPGMDLVHMSERLRKDWFVRYLLDPPGLRPGTRMPTFWPEGRSVLKNVLEGDTGLQVEAIWQYLSDGKQARLPVGIGPQPILLVPADEAILYRNFIQGGGPRAIGVGFPEKAHYAFDANQLRLALIWQGDFIDASKHWVDRGAGFQSPAGEGVLALHDGPPLAVLADPQATWPKEAGRAAGYRFEGYDLDARRRPAFLYRWNGAGVRDFIEAVEAKPAPFLKRTLTIEEAPPGAWYRAAVSKRIEAVGEKAWRLENGLQIRLEGAVGTLRAAGGGMELLVPAGGKRSMFVLNYAW